MKREVAWGARCSLCEKCLKTYHFLLSPKMVGLKGYKRYKVSYGDVWGAVATRAQVG